jgi:hypothetical protein
MSESDHEFWLYREPEKIADQLTEYHTNWYSWHGSPFKQMWLRNYLAYYSPAIHPSAWDTSLIFEGIQGELTRFYTPKARTLIRQLTAVVTKQRMAFQAAARTSGSEVLNEVKLANALSEQIVDTQRLNLKGDQLCEGGLVTGIWFTKATWRTDQGEPHALGQNGKVIRKGACEISLHSPFDVYYNLMLPWDDVPWAEVQVKRNRWDLIADFPDLENELKAVPSIKEAKGPNSWVDNQLDDHDLIYVYEFYHKPSPALPKGLMMVYADSETIFYHGENLYEGIPIEPNCPEAVLDTGMGYSKLTDLSGCQEMFDNSLSSVATNQSQFAVQNIAVPRGSNINVNEIDGMRFMSYTPQQVPGGGKPEPLQLTKTAPETFKFADKLEVLMQDMSYLNGAMTGNLPAGVSSGTAIATLSANSIEFITSISKSYNLCWEKTMAHAVNCYKRFADVPQTVKLQGKGGQVTHQEFTGADVQNVDGFKIETVNPLMKTFAGRLEIGEKLLSMPPDIWPEYVSIIEGQPLSNIYKGAVSETDLILQENEAMEKGQPVYALAVDDHPQHIKKHAECLKDVGNRANGTTIEAILAHIEEHYQLIRGGDPTLMALMQTGRIPEGGLQPPPSGPSGPPPAPGGMEGAGGPVAPDAPGPAPDEPPTVAPVVGDVAEPAEDLLERG